MSQPEDVQLTKSRILNSEPSGHARRPCDLRFHQEARPRRARKRRGIMAALRVGASERAQPTFLGVDALGDHRETAVSARRKYRIDTSVFAISSLPPRTKERSISSASTETGEPLRTVPKSGAVDGRVIRTMLPVNGRFGIVDHVETAAAHPQPAENRRFAAALQHEVARRRPKCPAKFFGSDRQCNVVR